ncbi:hypothetical protein EON83_10910 [bacterium]|nr:MAG: hypothetical protein EON83_10910 [bacterium]
MSDLLAVRGVPPTLSQPQKLNHSSQNVALHEGATVRAQLEIYGVRDVLVVSLQKHQAKVFAPGLGMFPVAIQNVEAAPNPTLLEWDRKVAQALVPVVGSLVNVRLDGEKSLVQARLEETLVDKGPDAHVRLSRGVLGRKSESLCVPRACVVGPHVPTKVRATNGDWVKDCARAKPTTAKARLHTVLAPSAKWRDAPAIEWVGSLKARRRAQVLVAEDAWFRFHSERVIRMARAQASRSGIQRREQIEELESAALLGALAGLRLWARRPARQRELVRRKLEVRFSSALVERLNDSELQTERALMRAFASVRDALLSPAFRLVEVSLEDWETVADISTSHITN